MHDRPPPPSERFGGGGGGGGGDDQHPLVAGLLMTLPKPGDVWNAKDRLNWLIMANSIFKTIYKTSADDGDLDVQLRMEAGSKQA